MVVKFDACIFMSITELNWTFVLHSFREHAMLAKTAGVKHLVVLVNKMDDPTVEWAEERLVSKVKCKELLTSAKMTT